jgi:chromosome segregation ATPase
VISAKDSELLPLQNSIAKLNETVETQKQIQAQRAHFQIEPHMPKTNPPTAEAAELKEKTGVESIKLREAQTKLAALRQKVFTVSSHAKPSETDRDSWQRKAELVESKVSQLSQD